MFRFLRTASLFLVALAFSSVGHAQGSQRVFVALANVGSTARVLANAQITVCTYTVGSKACTTPITVYQDPALSNPYPSTTFRADANGNYSYWVTPGNYIEQVCATGAACSTQIITLGATSAGGTFTINQGVAANGTTGALSTLPEKGFQTASGVTTAAWDEDEGMGRFDCRDTKYDGGCLGTTPGQAMQDLADAVTCYQYATGLHANVTFPPYVSIPVGTASQPTLNLPTGAYYSCASGNSNCLLHASYNNVLAVHIQINVSATCNGVSRTNTLENGKYTGIAEFGCDEGGCTNVPGDTGNYPNGGPSQIGLKIEDQGGMVDLVSASFNGGDGVEIGGEDTLVRRVVGESNTAWYIFGHTQTGQVYNPATDGLHGNIVLTSLDGTFEGPFETYGFLATPGAEYQHLAGVVWGGGNTGLGAEFSNRDQIGLIRIFANGNGRAVGGRIDAPMGEGIVAAGGGNTFTSIDNSTACSGFSTVSKGQIFGPFASTLGSGMTPGTYTVSAVNASGDTLGSGGALSVTVGSGGTVTAISVTSTGSLYQLTPTFTMTGTGGTPATIGATTYQHCDNLDDQGGQNSFVNVQNIYETFFGANYATGFIWPAVGSTYDRGTLGSFERKALETDTEAKGVGTHRDLLDEFKVGGGISVTGPSVAFTGSNHFVANDGSATSWTGPFTVENIMQDLWIMGGTGNTTLPVASGWQTCSGHDLKLAPEQWYHFLVFQDDAFQTIGTNFVFVEQCDTIFQDYQQIGFAALASAPTGNGLAASDVAGNSKVRTAPMVAPFFTTAGSSSAFTYTYALRCWFGGATAVSSTVTTSVTPVTPTSMQNVFFNYTTPQNWTECKTYLQSTTDSAFTADTGVWSDIVNSGTTPGKPTIERFALAPLTPTDPTTVPGGWIGKSSSGTYMLDQTNIPTGTSYPGTPGQIQFDATNNKLWICTSVDTWKSFTLTTP